jgi:hypothetical protein
MKSPNIFALRSKVSLILPTLAVRRQHHNLVIINPCCLVIIGCILVFTMRACLLEYVVPVNVWSLVIVVVVMDSWCYPNMHLRCKTSCSFSSRSDCSLCRLDSLSAVYHFPSIGCPTCNGRRSNRFDEKDLALLANGIRRANESNQLFKSRLTFTLTCTLNPSHISFCHLSIGSVKEMTIGYSLFLHRLFMYL